LLAGYGLPDLARELLVALALYKIRRLLAAGLRLRTACDLTPLGDLQIDAPAAFNLPDENTLLKAVQSRIAECAKASLFANPPVTELSVKASFKKKKTAKEKDEADDDQVTDDGVRE
jgi:CRISPR-associated protein Csb1